MKRREGQHSAPRTLGLVVRLLLFWLLVSCTDARRLAHSEHTPVALCLSVKDEHRSGTFSDSSFGPAAVLQGRRMTLSIHLTVFPTDRLNDTLTCLS